MNLRSVAVLLLLLASIGCSQPAPPPNPGVQNTALGIKLSAVPDGLEVAANREDSLELTPREEDRGGLLWFTVRPQQYAVNLVAAVNSHQAWIESLPDGSYQGAQELQGDIGNAFYSRGRFLDAGSEVEETVLFLIHPAGDRLLEIHYRYPAGEDSADRVGELIEVLSYLE